MDEQQNTKNNKLPIIVAAIVSAVLLISAIIVVIIFANKTEYQTITTDIKEVKSYNILQEIGDDELMEIIRSNRVISGISELRDFYNELAVYYTGYPYFSEAGISYQDATNCIDGPEWTNCGGDIYPRLEPEDLRFDMPEELDEAYFNEHDILITVFGNNECSGGFSRVRDVSKIDEVVTVEIGYDGGCGLCATIENVILVEVGKNLVSESDIIKTTKYRQSDPSCRMY